MSIYGMYVRAPMVRACGHVSGSNGLERACSLKVSLALYNVILRNMILDYNL